MVIVVTTFNSFVSLLSRAFEAFHTSISDSGNQITSVYPGTIQHVLLAIHIIAFSTRFSLLWYSCCFALFLSSFPFFPHRAYAGVFFLLFFVLLLPCSSSCDPVERVRFLLLLLIAAFVLVISLCHIICFCVWFHNSSCFIVLVVLFFWSGLCYCILVPGTLATHLLYPFSCDYVCFSFSLSQYVST